MGDYKNINEWLADTEIKDEEDAKLEWDIGDFEYVTTSEQTAIVKNCEVYSNIDSLVIEDSEGKITVIKYKKNILHRLWIKIKQWIEKLFTTKL